MKIINTEGNEPLTIEHLDALKPGELIWYAVKIKEATHGIVLIATREEGIHTSRRRYCVACTTCRVLMHEATTGPLERVEQHVSEVVRGVVSAR